jgi:hypothetical protein
MNAEEQRELLGRIAYEAAAKVTGCDQPWVGAHKEKWIAAADAVFRACTQQMQVWCNTCNARSYASWRPGEDSKDGTPYEDLCCDTCNYVIATVTRHLDFMETVARFQCGPQLTCPDGTVHNYSKFTTGIDEFGRGFGTTVCSKCGRMAIDDTYRL